MGLPFLVLHSLYTLYFVLLSFFNFFSLLYCTVYFAYLSLFLYLRFHVTGVNITYTLVCNICCSHYIPDGMVPLTLVFIEVHLLTGFNILYFINFECCSILIGCLLLFILLLYIMTLPVIFLWFLFYCVILFNCLTSAGRQMVASLWLI